MQYEWDDAKNRANIAKHGVSFEEAPLLFNGRVVETADDDNDEGRFIALSLIRGFVFVCVYTDRDDVRRIISLRRATGYEQKTYFSDS